jgi:ferredoxin
LLLEEHGILVAIDRAACIGNGVCVAVAPRAFALDDLMKAVVLAPETETEANLLQAAEMCPTQAIYLSVDGESLYP